MYPEAKKMVAYGEFRQAWDKDPEGEKLLMFGLGLLANVSLLYVCDRQSICVVGYSLLLRQLLVQTMDRGGG
jgi:hypothetical protein